MKIWEKPIPPRIHSLHGAGGALSAHSRPPEHQSLPPRNRKATFPDTIEHRANPVEPPTEQNNRRKGGIDKDMTVGSINLVSSSRPMEPTGSPTTNKPSPNHRSASTKKRLITLRTRTTRRLVDGKETYLRRLAPALAGTINIRF